jgi:hypothetical protein
MPSSRVVSLCLAPSDSSLDTCGVVRATARRTARGALAELQLPRWTAPSQTKKRSSIGTAETIHFFAVRPRLVPTSVDTPRRIVNISPRSGEMAEYHVDYSRANRQPSDDFWLVSMLSGIEGRHRLLLVDGVNAEGPRTALEFVTVQVYRPHIEVRCRISLSLCYQLRNVSQTGIGHYRFQTIVRGAAVATGRPTAGWLNRPGLPLVTAIAFRCPMTASCYTQC